MNPSTGSIVVARKRHLGFSKKLGTTLIVDGQSHGRLRPGETVEVDTNPGPHSVLVVVRGDSSKKLVVDVHSDEQVALIVSSWPGQVWFNVLLLGRVTHIRLRTVQKDSRAWKRAQFKALRVASGS